MEKISKEDFTCLLMKLANRWSKHSTLNTTFASLVFICINWSILWAKINHRSKKSLITNAHAENSVKEEAEILEEKVNFYGKISSCMFWGRRSEKSSEKSGALE